MSAGKPTFHAALFDLDDTLYQKDEIRSHVGERIVQYMLDNLGFLDRDVALRKCRELYINFGTTYAGLAAEGYVLDADHFHQAVHGSIDYERYLQPDPELRELLSSLNMPRFVFTNSDLLHTERCLQLLGISDCFQGIVHFENIQEEAKVSAIEQDDLPIVCKPHPLAYHLAASLVHCFDNTIPPPPPYPYSSPSTALQNYMFFDDSARNVPAALELGIFSVLIRPNAPTDIPCSLSANSLLDLKDILPQLANKSELSSSDSLATLSGKCSSSAASLDSSQRQNHHLVNGGTGVPHINGAAQHSSGTIGMSLRCMYDNSITCVHGYAACTSVHIHGKPGQAESRPVCAGGMVLAEADGTPVRHRGARSSSPVCESCCGEKVDNDLNSTVQLPAVCHADEGEESADILTKVSSFFEAVRNSLSADSEPVVDRCACDEWSQEGSERRWASDLLELDLEDVVSHHVVHANSVQKAIEAETEHWEEELLVRELGEITQRSAQGQQSLSGNTGGVMDNAAGLHPLQTAEVWDATWVQGVSCGVALLGSFEPENAAGDVQSVPDALRRAARAGRHVWVHKHA